MKKRLSATLLSLLLAFTLVLAMGTAVTAEETWTEVNSADALKTALNDGGNIKLTGNIDVSERQSWTIDSGVNVVLDLNGYSITSTYNASNYFLFTVNGGSLTLNDSSDKGTGKVEIKDASSSYPLQLKGTGSSFTMNGGTIMATEDALDIYTSAKNTTVNINGGTMSSQSYSTLAIRGSNTVVNISGGLIENNSSYGAYGAFVSSSDSSDPNSIVFNMTGGKLTSTGTGILTDYALTVNIGGEAAIETKGAGISVKGTTVLNVNGGSITSESYAIQANYNNTVNITGGDIKTTSTNSAAVQVGTNSDATINGGTITGKKVLNGNEENITVTGGTFTDGENKIDVSEYIPTGTLYQNEDGTVVPTEESVAKVNNIPYTSLDDAIKAAANGETITLLKNIKLEKYISSGTKTVIDLAGYKITAPDGSYIIVVAKGCSFTLNDSSEEGTGALTGGTGDNSHAGAVTVQNGGSFTMNGGNIIGNTGTTSAAGVSLGSDSSFTMTGGSITDNTSTGNIQAGVYADCASTVTISGNVNITGNVGNEFGTKVDSDLWLNTSEGATLKIGEDGLAEDARIGVYVNGGVNDVKNFTDTYERGKATTENFISNRTKYYVIEVETENGVAAAMTLYKSAAPTASLAPGSYVGTQTVALSTTTWPNLTDIYYTTDGSDPKTSKTTQTYTEPLTIDKTMTVKAYTSGLPGDYLASDVAEFAYTITAPVTLYTITVPDSVTGGAVSVSPTQASYGSTVTITVAPGEGYELDELTATDSGGNKIELTKVSDTEYTFSMPRSDVTVSASFRAISHEDNCRSADYTDVDTGAWYHEAIDFAIENDLMNGVGDNLFNPDGNLSRAMMVRILWNMEDQPTNVSGSYSDVVAGAWYEKAVLWATANNIVNGYPDGSFGPDNSITRQEMAAILYRYAQFKEYDMTAEDDLTRFPDGDETAEWAETFVRWAVAEGLLNGRDDGTLDPAGTATRAEVAQIFMNYCEKIAK